MGSISLQPFTRKREMKKFYASDWARECGGAAGRTLKSKTLRGGTEQDVRLFVIKMISDEV